MRNILLQFFFAQPKPFSGECSLPAICFCFSICSSFSVVSWLMSYFGFTLLFISEQNQFLFSLLFRATPVANGSSQARGWIGATAASLCHSHSNEGSEPGLQPTPQLTATLDSQPTQQGHAPSWILVRFVNHWATKGTPKLVVFFLTKSLSELCIRV